jgi:hypothetical protein
MEALLAAGEFSRPSLASLESALEYGLSLRAGRVFADLWDVEQFSRCPDCSQARIGRIAEMNASQAILARVRCDRCD